MNHLNRFSLGALAALLAVLIPASLLKARSPQNPAPQGTRAISSDDCTSAKLGSAIPVSAIGEPVAGVTLAAPRWVAAAGNAPAYCSIDGAMAPTDTSANGR